MVQQLAKTSLGQPRAGGCRLAPVVIAAATAVALAPLFLYGVPANSWDARFHAIEIRHFSDQLWDGELYPRWLVAMNFGLGSPHFFYYSPLAYYFASLFDWFHAPNGLPQMTLAEICLLFLSGLACHLWLSRLTDPVSALIGSVFYIAAPYHVFVDSYIRGDYAEFAAYVWLPLLLHGVELIKARRAVGFPLIAASYAGLILTHIVIGLIYSGIPILYAIGRLGRRDARSGVILVGAASTLGLAVAGVYLLPAMTTQDAVQMPIGPMSDVAFVFGSAHPSPRLFLFILALFVAYAALLAGIATALWRCRRGKLNSFEATLLIIAAAYMMLMTAATRPIWDALPMLRAVQYTYRLNTFVDLALAGLMAAAASASMQRFGERRVLAAALGSIALVAIVADGYAVSFGLFDVDRTLWEKRALYSPDYGLFRPRSAGALPADGLPLFSGGAFGQDLPPYDKVQVDSGGETTIRVTQWRPRDIRLALEAATAGTATVAQLYYPGWEAVSMKTGRTVRANPAGRQGLVEIAFEAGSDEVALRLAPRPVETLGWFVSGLGVLLLLYISIVLRRSWSATPSC